MVPADLALWYHALALTGWSGDGELSWSRPGYAEDVAAIKRARGAGPTTLDRLASEFLQQFEAEPEYRALWSLPLYFVDGEALSSGIRLWERAAGDPGAGTSPEAARLIRFLSSQFPRAAQRETVAEWLRVVDAENREFFQTYWADERPDHQAAADRVGDAWNGIAPRLSNFLRYSQRVSGELVLVPGLGTEPRIADVGLARVRAVVPLRGAGREDESIWSFIIALFEPIADDAMRDYVAPARIREVGADALRLRTAVRGGALLLERTAPEHVRPYRRHVLEGYGSSGSGRDGPEIEAEFVRRFPLPADLERGLATVVERATAGI